LISQEAIEQYKELARIYFSKGDKANATKRLDGLLDAWKDADPGLPLLKDARSPKKEIDSKT
jgi:hypothetical protein